MYTMKKLLRKIDMYFVYRRLRKIMTTKCPHCSKYGKCNSWSKSEGLWVCVSCGSYSTIIDKLYADLYKLDPDSKLRN